jgi:hypothetical protein
LHHETGGLKMEDQNQQKISLKNLNHRNFGQDVTSAFIVGLLDEDIEKLVGQFHEKGFFPAKDKADYIRDDHDAIVLKNEDNIYVVFHKHFMQKHKKKSIYFGRYFLPESEKIYAWGNRLADCLCSGEFLYSYMNPDWDKEKKPPRAELVQWVENSTDAIFALFYDDEARKEALIHYQPYAALLMPANPDAR